MHARCTLATAFALCPSPLVRSALPLYTFGAARVWLFTSSHAVPVHARCRILSSALHLQHIFAMCQLWSCMLIFTVTSFFSFWGVWCTTYIRIGNADQYPYTPGRVVVNRDIRSLLNGKNRFRKRCKQQCATLCWHVSLSDSPGPLHPLDRSENKWIRRD